LLDRARRANRASIESIQTLHCKFVSTYTSLGVTETPKQGEYWRDRGVVRIRTVVPGGTEDKVAKGSVVRSLGTGNGQNDVGVIAPLGGGPLALCDVWWLSLFVWPDPKHGPELVTFDEMLQHGQEVGNVDERSESGHKHIVVELVTRDRKYEVWFDPRVNYLVRRIIATKKERRTEVSVTSFAESKPGIFFPERIEMTSTNAGKQMDARSAVFSDIRVNEPISPAVFDRPFPRGLHVEDLVMGKSYVTNAQGEPGTQFEDLMVGGAPSRAMPKDVTREETRPWSRWILPASLGALGGAFALWIRRRWSPASRN
jgi:hypothetical protein